MNDLTPKQLEALALVMGECSEVIHIIGKIIQHGLKSEDPKSQMDNKTLLIEEMGDTLAVFEIVQKVLGLNEFYLKAAKDSKLKRVQQYLHHIKPGDFT